MSNLLQRASKRTTLQTQAERRAHQPDIAHIVVGRNSEGYSTYCCRAHVRSFRYPLMLERKMLSNILPVHTCMHTLYDMYMHACIYTHLLFYVCICIQLFFIASTCFYLNLDCWSDLFTYVYVCFYPFSLLLH